MGSYPKFIIYNLFEGLQYDLKDISPYVLGELTKNR